MSRYDCVLYIGQVFQSIYKIYRDGTAVRCSGSQGQIAFLGYDLNEDLVFTNMHLSTPHSNWYNDPIGLKYDFTKPAALTHTGWVLPDATFNAFVWGNNYYTGSVATITKRNLATGASEGTYVTTGSITPFSMDRFSITPDGWIVAIDYDNGSFGVVRFYNVYTAQQYTSTIDKSKLAWVDWKNKNIWSVKLSDSKLQIYTFEVAPASFSAITLGGNRSRYRQDSASVTLRGSNNEPVPFWPVAWSLTTGEGHLQEDYTETDIDGIATNVYCGPGVTDYVGGSQTIEVSTGY
jgi:hypothetical protein